MNLCEIVIMHLKLRKNLSLLKKFSCLSIESSLEVEIEKLNFHVMEKDVPLMLNQRKESKIKKSFRVSFKFNNIIKSFVIRKMNNRTKNTKF